MQTVANARLRAEIKRLIMVFMIGLILSGLTAFPLEWELGWLKTCMRVIVTNSEFNNWIELIHQGLKETNSQYPFIAYGTDWLAFAHLVITIAFIGPLRDPIRNIWVIEFGLIACAAVIPLALIAGYIRHIPIYWQLFDCTFGLTGGTILWICYEKIRILSAQSATVAEQECC